MCLVIQVFLNQSYLPNEQELLFLLLDPIFDALRFDLTKFLLGWTCDFLGHPCGIFNLLTIFQHGLAVVFLLVVLCCVSHLRGVVPGDRVVG